MLTVHVDIHVKPEFIDTFKEATVANGRESVLEPGVVRFDCLQKLGDPERFVLVEVYREPEAQLRHRETRHYQVWRDAVAPMMAEPRVGVKYVKIFPEDP
jgi:quinol monooxygenase YgiN